ncbi:MAG: hypothetical protein ACLFQX_07435 [Candidatus Kapaibacterium sp.]
MIKNNISPQLFWDLFANEFPVYMKNYPAPKKFYTTGKACTTFLLSFFAYLTTTLQKEIDPGLRWAIEKDRIDFVYLLNNKPYIAIESENITTRELNGEFNNFIKVQNTCKFNVLIWYYDINRAETSKINQLCKISDRLYNYYQENIKFSDFLLILGPNAGISHDENYYYRLLQKRDYEGYQFDSKGEYYQLKNYNILQAL